MAKPDIDIEVWASESYTLPNAQTINKIRPITDLWRKGYDLGEKPDCQAWNYVWNMLCVWMQYVAEEQIPGLDDVFLKKTGNLSELSDKVTSRTNLGVYSKAETDDRYLQLTGGTVNGGLKITGNGNVSLGNQGLALRWNETDGSGAAFFVNNQGGGSGGFVFRNTNAAGTETGRLTIQGDGSLVTGATVRGGQLTSTGDASVAGTTTTANLTVQSNNAVVGGRHVVRSVNGATADANGNATISLPAQGVMDVRLGAEISAYRYDYGSESFTYRVNAGCVLTGINIWSKSSNNDEFRYMYSRPIQKYINGAWYTVGQI